MSIKRTLTREVRQRIEVSGHVCQTYKNISFEWTVKKSRNFIDLHCLDFLWSYPPEEKQIGTESCKQDKLKEILTIENLST